jgi:Cys-tRNA synthase (O-phospho-L-seryl-tRNA:Cys-tRNA synthase)
VDKRAGCHLSHIKLPGVCKKHRTLFYFLWQGLKETKVQGEIVSGTIQVLNTSTSSLSTPEVFSFVIIPAHD